jgi:phenylacetate-CoA ligase
VFTLFDSRLDTFARETIAEHRRLDAGTGPADDIRWARLRETVRYVAARSPFYGKRLGHVDPDGLVPGELARLPFTTKDDLREQGYDLLSRPVPEAWVFYETTGTTGRATPCPRDNVDSIVNNTALTVCYDAVFREHGTNHVVAVLGPSELHSTGDTFGDVCRNLGHAVAKMWPHSPVIGFPRALQLMRELAVTALFCTPGMALSLAKEAAKAGLDPRTDFAVRLFLLTGELATPSLLTGIGGLWGATAYNCLYASQEASVLGAVHADGRLRTVPSNVWYELIEPETGRPAPGEEGELVVTHLYQGSKPLVRYRTGDLVRLTANDPAAPYPAPTMLPLGRVRDVLDLNGHRVTAYELEELILSRAGGCVDYAVTVDRTGGVDTLTVTLEPAPRRDPPDVRGIAAALADRWETPASVRFEQLGAITTTGAMVSWKAARVHDRRRAPDAERRAALAIAGQREAR